MTTIALQEKEIHEQVAAVVSRELSVRDIPEWMGEALRSVGEALASEGLAPLGPPFARYTVLGGDRFEVEAGFPCSFTLIGSELVHPITLPAGRVLCGVHVGPYDEMEYVYKAIEARLADEGAVASGPPWEVYLTNPEDHPDPTSWVTEVIQPFVPAD